MAAVGIPGAGGINVLGDCVNAAFRLESATKELATDVVLGKVAFEYLLLPKSSQFFEAKEVKLKGYDRPVKTWAISFAQLAKFLQHLDECSTRAQSRSAGTVTCVKS